MARCSRYEIFGHQSSHGKWLPPDTPIGAVCVDDLVAGVVHVAARVFFCGAGGDESEFGVDIGQFRQGEYIAKGCFVVGAASQVEAMVKHDGEFGETSGQGFQFGAFIAVGKGVHGDSQCFGRFPEPIDAGMIQPSVRGGQAAQSADVGMGHILLQQGGAG